PRLTEVSASCISRRIRWQSSRKALPSKVSVTRRVVRCSSFTPRRSSRASRRRDTTAGDMPSARAAALRLPRAATATKVAICLKRSIGAKGTGARGAPSLPPVVSLRGVAPPVDPQPPSVRSRRLPAGGRRIIRRYVQRRAIQRPWQPAEARSKMSLRVRLTALVTIFALAMTAVAFLLPNLALESAGTAVWKERRETAEAGLRRDWARAQRDMAVTGPLLERAIEAPSAALATQWLQRPILASGASRGWVRAAQGTAPVERGDNINFHDAPGLEPLLVTARNAARASGLVVDGQRAAWVEVIGLPGTSAAAVLELSIDSRLARRLADAAGVEVALAGVPVRGGPVTRLGSDTTADFHQRLFDAAASFDARRRATDTGDSTDSIRLLRLEATDDIALVGAIANRDIGAGAQLEEFRLVPAAAPGGIALGGIIAIVVAASSIRKGILALDRAARELIAGRGQYQPVVRAGRDELAQLSATFNTMHEAEIGRAHV